MGAEGAWGEIQNRVLEYMMILVLFEDPLPQFLQPAKEGDTGIYVLSKTRNHNMWLRICRMRTEKRT